MTIKSYKDEIDATFAPLSEEQQRQRCRFMGIDPPIIESPAVQRAWYGWQLFKRWEHEEIKRRRAATLPLPPPDRSG